MLHNSRLDFVFNRIYLIFTLIDDFLSEIKNFELRNFELYTWNESGFHGSYVQVLKLPMIPIEAVYYL